MKCHTKPGGRALARHTCVLALVAATAGLVAGCEVAPEEAVNGLLRAVARGDMRRAGMYCMPSLRAALTNFPGCTQLLRYSVLSLRWEVQNLYAATNGMLAVVPFVCVRETPPPNITKGALYVHLVEDDGVWRALAIEVDVPEYVEFVTTPQGNGQYSMWSLTKPRWECKQTVRESLPVFARRVEAYWWSFRE
ncbi:MAG: hypothetical protein N2595_06215 [bacterium]|nr:hypothetical protein [bacterium]